MRIFSLVYINGVRAWYFVITRTLGVIVYTRSSPEATSELIMLAQHTKCTHTLYLYNIYKVICEWGAPLSLECIYLSPFPHYNYIERLYIHITTACLPWVTSKFGGRASYRLYGVYIRIIKRLIYNTKSKIFFFYLYNKQFYLFWVALRRNKLPHAHIRIYR